MKKIIVAVFAITLLFGAFTAQAADVKKRFSVQEAMSLEKVKNALENDIAFYWGKSAHPPVSKTFGVYKTSKRTNGFRKDHFDACSWAMASALVTLRDRARREGGNAVINIVSNIKDYEESSESEFSCLVGGLMVNVALKGTVVKLGQ
ncbi:MAG: hypothetical protein CSB32_01100 [Desulfobacterales bacterium]|nr:MAG: hypothetical protein CSB32_01100 [Desulfobacterales bacterium]